MIGSGRPRANLNGRSMTITYEELCRSAYFEVDSKVNGRRLPFDDVVPEQGKQVSMNK